MDLTGFAFKRKQFTLALILLFALSGISAYLNMPRAEDPGYIVRRAQVTTRMPGASPERMEELVTDKIEKRIQEMPEVDYIESESKTGISIVKVNILDSYTETRPIWDSLRRKVEDAEQDLPPEAAKPKIEDSMGDVFGIVFAIHGDGFSHKQLDDISDAVRDEILTLDQVAKVERYGVQDERIFIQYTNEKLAEVGLSPQQLASLLKARNIINSGGILETDYERLALEPTGSFNSVEELENTLIEVPQTNKIIRLKNIAQVFRDTVDPPKSIMRTSGFQTVGIAVNMREGGNIIRLGQDVNALLDRLQEQYPIGIEFEMISFQPERVEKTVDSFMSNLLQAVVIVTCVMLLFLGLRTGLVVASLIPLAILFAFVLMAFLGIGLDRISLAALMIALGMLVDNSIVVSESCMVEMEGGKEPEKAAIDSCKELNISLLISSLTTAVAFMPIYLAESSVGEFCASLFIVVSITLLSSWFIAMTFIPLLCSRFLKVEKKQEEETEKGWVYAWYRSFLSFMLRHSYGSISVLLLAFFLAIFGMRFVPHIFFPPNDNPLFTAEYDLPVGAPIRWSESIAKEIDTFIADELQVSEERQAGVISWVDYIGNGGPRYRLQHNSEPPNPHYIFSLFTATSYADLFPIIRRLENFIAERFPDLKGKIQPLQDGAAISNPIEVRLSGKDLDTLYSISEAVQLQLDSTPGTRNVVDDWGLKTKKIVVHVDEARAQRASVTNEDVARSLETAISGVALTQYREGINLIPVIMRSVVAADADLIASETFNVYSSTARSVPITQVADISIEWQPSQIKRRNRLKTITVQCGLQEGFTASQVANELIPWLEEEAKHWPMGFRWELGGEVSESSKSADSVKAAMPLAAILITALLMAQFNSVRKTVIVLFTIPLSIIGVVIGLLLMQSYFGFMTLLGVISLAGVVINNAIVLIDRIDIERDLGRSLQEAIVTASEKRLRPILLTTVTTICGLIPLWYGGGLMWEPMAIALIFGLAIATVLTLGAVPVLYSIFYTERD